MVEESTRILNAETTVFFKENRESMDQKVDVIVESRDILGAASLKASIAGVERVSVIKRLLAGRNTYSIDIPEVRTDSEATFLLEAAGGVVDVYKTKLLPRKRWEVIFVPLAHHDYGYTDPIEELLPLYDGFYDSVREFLHETADWPEEAAGEGGIRGGADRPAAGGIPRRGRPWSGREGSP